MEYGLSITGAGAFLGGLISIASPCTAMMLPAFFAYAFASRRQIIARTSVFLLGLLTTLLPIGAFAGSLGAHILVNRSGIIGAAALIVVGLGLIQALGLTIPVHWLSWANFTRSKKISNQLDAATVAKTHQHTQEALEKLEFSKSNIAEKTTDLPKTKPVQIMTAKPKIADKQASWLAVYALGLVFGISSVCSGPILGSVLTMAALGKNTAYGIGLLGIYALGMALPTLVLALLWDSFDLGGKAWFKPKPVRLGFINTTVSNLAAGGLFVGLGLVLFFSRDSLEGTGIVSAQTQAIWEMRIKELTANVPDMAVVLLVIALLLIFGLVAYKAHKKIQK